ncbi:hypothetical protein BpHYR1_035257 [Brachionus plicatilis]|uniref:Uncharacterized protein n=1 Tax=Brachionus plicatilis TaxID=10195 RepID=A0A3M7SAN9_BRAPC|nr:hypothetical protein BpHYR1_035257 [Brachionus plicatilis]
MTSERPFFFRLGLGSGDEEDEADIGGVSLCSLCGAAATLSRPAENAAISAAGYWPWYTESNMLDTECEVAAGELAADGPFSSLVSSDILAQYITQIVCGLARDNKKAKEKD